MPLLASGGEGRAADRVARLSSDRVCSLTKGEGPASAATHDPLGTTTPLAAGVIDAGNGDGVECILDNVLSVVAVASLWMPPDRPGTAGRLRDPSHHEPFIISSLLLSDPIPSRYAPNPLRSKRTMANSYAGHPRSPEPSCSSSAYDSS